MSLLVTFGVNGQIASVEVSPWKRLLDVLREDLHLTGTKEGCGEGECGACTVLLDGVPVNSCLVAAGQCDGRAVTTVEGLARGSAAEPLLHAVQRELVARGVFRLRMKPRMSSHSPEPVHPISTQSTSS